MKKFNYCNEKMARSHYRKYVTDVLTLDCISKFSTENGYLDLLDWFYDFHIRYELEWYLGGYYE